MKAEFMDHISSKDVSQLICYKVSNISMTKWKQGKKVLDCFPKNKTF